MKENLKLKDLYLLTSKHSHYQVLPSVLSKLLDITGHVQSRYEKERLDFIKKKVSFKNKRILDIGGNTGYFSFEAIDSCAREVVHMEGNPTHSEFVKYAAQLIDFNIKAINSYLDFDKDLENEKYDIVLNLNVIHHLGDDFEADTTSKESAKRKMQETFSFFKNKCDIMVFQMGFNWKGDRNEPLFEKGTKSEMIDFVREAIKSNWEILFIGIAEKKGEDVIYNPLNYLNIERKDELGEFLNRPLFILSSNS